MNLAVAGFDWDSDNLEKCRTHGVEIADIEAMFRQLLWVIPDPAHSHGEDRLRAIGTDRRGRHIFAVFTLRSRDGETLIRQSARATCTRRKFITMKRKKPKLKKLPVLKTDETAEKFVATSDLSKYDLAGMVPVRFEFLPKTERVNMRLPEDLLNSVKDCAAREGVPYQRYIRLALERAVTERKRSKAKAS